MCRKETGRVRHLPTPVLRVMASNGEVRWEAVFCSHASRTASERRLWTSACPFGSTCHRRSEPGALLGKSLQPAGASLVLKLEVLGSRQQSSKQLYSQARANMRLQIAQRYKG